MPYTRRKLAATIWREDASLRCQARLGFFAFTRRWLVQFSLLTAVEVQQTAFEAAAGRAFT